MRIAVLIIAGITMAIDIAQAEPMTFVMDPFPPFTYEENGVVAGPMADTIRAVCGSMAIECELSAHPWRRALKMTEDGDVDGLFAVVKLPEREKYMYVTEPIIESAYGVFVPTSSSLKYSAPVDLDGYTVGAYGPSAASRALEEIARLAPTMRIVIEIDNSILLKKLSALRYGDKGAAVVNVDVGQYLINQESIPDLKVVGSIKKTEYSIGLSRKKVSKEQAARFNATLNSLVKDGVVRRIIEMYGLKPAL